MILLTHTCTACTGNNCREMKTYSVCDSPGNISVAPERLNTTSNTSCTYSHIKLISIVPSATVYANAPSCAECIPVTTTAYKTLSQLSKCTMITTIITAITEPSPSPQCTVLSTSEMMVTPKTSVITEMLPASVSQLCSCSKLGNNIQPLLNTTLSIASQTLPSTLGALLGIIVIALVVTTTGWVWTCCRMRKRGGTIKINSSLDERER